MTKNNVPEGVPQSSISEKRGTGLLPSPGCSPCEPTPATDDWYEDETDALTYAEHLRGLGIPPPVKDASAGLCGACGGMWFWQGIYGGPMMCCKCETPPALSMVKRISGVVSVGWQECTEFVQPYLNEIFPGFNLGNVGELGSKANTGKDGEAGGTGRAAF